MKTAGWIFMLLAWIGIFIMDVFCFYHIFTSEKKTKGKNDQ